MSHPRTHSLADDPGASFRRMFEGELDRPLLIVGNGPSASAPRHDLLPDDPVVFRMNWFFLEDRYYFGRRVDALFFSIPNALLEARIRDVALGGEYSIGAVASPMKVASGRDGEPHASRLFEAGVEEVDHWAVIASNPVLARFMMSRPLPTQGAQVLGAALELGFRDITLCGIDMYESTEARYGNAIPDDVRAALQPKDLTPGYEDAHSLDRDLDFIDACLVQFPDADVKHVGPSRHLAARLTSPTARDRPCRFDGTPADELVRAPKRPWTVDEDGSAELSSQGVELPSAIIDGKRCGYVTLVGGNFHHGARALANSLAKVSDVPLLVMCTPNADRAALRASGLNCIDIPDVFNPNRLSSRTARFAVTYSKLNAFRMTHLDRAVYLDSDMIVLQPIDELFSGTGFAAAPDHGLTHEYDRFNSGLFAFDPSADDFAQMLEFVRDTSSYDQGDQGFLNEYFGDWTALPHEFNVNKRWSSHHPNLFRLENTRVLHYVGIKPWQIEPPSAYDELYRLWFEQLSTSELIEVVESLRTEGAAASVSSRGGTRKGVSGFQRRRLERIAGLTQRDPRAIESVDQTAAWPGDHAASASAMRSRGTAQMLAGDFDDGLRTLRTAAERFPTDATVLASLRKAEWLHRVRRLTLGAIPETALAGAASRLTRTGRSSR